VPPRNHHGGTLHGFQASDKAPKPDAKTEQAAAGDQSPLVY